MSVRSLVAAFALAASTACTTPAAVAVESTPAAQLAALPVRVEDTGAHYRRTDWGSWSTVGQCSTRERVLARDAEPGAVVGDGCVVAGRWESLYDGVTVVDPRRLQIDHVVPLAEAARSGARNWTPARRRAYFNDVRNLRAVTGRANEQKGDGDPPRWVPPARGAWCWYATVWVRTKTAYGLSADAAEVAWLRRMLGTCGGR